MAKELQKRGCHAVAIKDMAGLLKPYARRELVKALKDALDIPIQLHTPRHLRQPGGRRAHWPPKRGVDIVDLAISSMSSLTSPAVPQRGGGRPGGPGARHGHRPAAAAEAGRLLGRPCASATPEFESDLKTPFTEIYRYEIPGGQYSNLKPQVESLGLGDRFEDVKEMYKQVNDMLGDLVKVTPSSKMVGDMAIFMVQHDLTPENILEKGADLSYPDSVISYFKGMMGQPAWGFPEELQKIVLKGEKAHHLPPRRAAAPRRISPAPASTSRRSWATCSRSAARMPRSCARPTR